VFGDQSVRMPIERPNSNPTFSADIQIDILRVITEGVDELER
jgi:hypothetical protein